MRWLALLAGFAAAAALAQGKLEFSPEQGAVGTRVQVRATGLPPLASLDLIWITADAGWRIENTLYKGVQARERKIPLAKASANARGEASFGFTVPEDFGYVHNVLLLGGENEIARHGFTVVPAFSISPTSGPAGTPITLRLTGLGYRFYERGRHLYYDQKYTGWLSAITTSGTALATIRATGEVGPHLLELINGPRRGYLNGEQSPNYIPAIPYRNQVVFHLTRGPVVLPGSPASQAFPRERAQSAEEPRPTLNADFRSGTVGSLIRFDAHGFPADSKATLSYRTVRGNRIGGGGWEESDVPLGEFSTDGDGRIRLTLPTPDDLEGERLFTVKSADRQAQFAYRITPSIARFGPSPVKPGGELHIGLKGTGWTSTGNIYTLLMDNGYVGYACGFNSRGDISITLAAPLKRGWHFIDLYPSVYEGTSDAPTATTTNDHFQLPMLNEKDHPGERLPVFHLAFEVK